MSDEGLKFGADDLNSPRDKLIELVEKDMSRDNRIKIGFKLDGNLMMCATYVASIEGCTQHRAIAAVSAMGCGILYYLEKNYIDNDKYMECKSIIPKMLVSGVRISEIISDAIVNKFLFRLDGKSVYVNTWDDASGFISGFADRYYMEGHSTASATFWIGLDKLMSNEELYKDLANVEEVMSYVSLAKAIPDQINAFNVCICDLNNGGHLFHDF